MVWKYVVFVVADRGLEWLLFFVAVVFGRWFSCMKNQHLYAGLAFFEAVLAIIVVLLINVGDEKCQCFFCVTRFYARAAQKPPLSRQAMPLGGLNSKRQCALSFRASLRSPPIVETIWSAAQGCLAVATVTRSASISSSPISLA